MKNIIILISLSICVSWQNVKAQRTPVSNKINFEELRFKSGNGNVFKIGDTKNIITSSLGQPDSDEYFYFEMDAADGRLLIYSQNRILLKQDKFYTLTFKDGSIEIGRNGNYFK